MLRRILKGVGHTVWYGVFLSLIAIFAYANSSDPIGDYLVPLRTMILLYIGTSLLSGVILGVLMPFAGNSGRVSLVGIGVALPPALLIMFFVNDAQPSQMTSMDMLIALGIAAVLGPLAATYMRLRGHLGAGKAQ